MLIFLIGSILGLLFTRLYRYRLGFSNIGLSRLSMYLFGISLSLFYSLCLVIIFSSVSPIEYYTIKDEHLGSIRTIQKIHGNLYAGFGEVKEEFFYRCMVQRKDAVIYSIEIPSNISVIYEDNSSPHVISISTRNPGLWQFITFSNSKIYAYAIHVPVGTTIAGGAIQ